MSEFKLSVFEEVQKDVAEDILARRKLGYSHLRLLPKSTGVRPIVNMRRRMMTKNRWGRGGYLGPSINSLMTPAFNILSYEKTQQPERLGSAISSVTYLYPRIKAFKERLTKKGLKLGDKPLYFVKLDARSCFDTIPQEELLKLIEQVLSEDEYRIRKHVEVRPPDNLREKNDIEGHKLVWRKPVKRYISQATGFSDLTSLHDTVARSGDQAVKRQTVYVDTSFHRKQDADGMLEMLDEHVRNNLIKIGKKFFRQKNGIPQGSMLSSLLCNFFYGEHEREKLGFLQRDEALLLRLVDDYLLITTEISLAQQFLQVMLGNDSDLGNDSSRYGISVNVDKSLVNFTITVSEQTIPQLLGPSPHEFPYCGTLIDTRTLALRKDYLPRDADVEMGDSLTVETTKAPGHATMRKALMFFQLHSHTMFLDTKHNSILDVWTGIYANFIQAAIKLHRYIRSLSQRQRRSRGGNDNGSAKGKDSLDKLLRRSVSAIMELAVQMVDKRNLSCACAVTSSQVKWLGAAGIGQVFGRKQTRFCGTVRWLEMVRRENRPKSDGEAEKLWRVVRSHQKRI